MSCKKRGCPTLQPPSNKPTPGCNQTIARGTSTNIDGIVGAHFRSITIVNTAATRETPGPACLCPTPPQPSRRSRCCLQTGVRRSNNTADEERDRYLGHYLL